MLKEQIISLLSGDSFSDYMAGMDLLEQNIGKSTLPDSELDQDIIERACAILIFEKWAQYDDYFSELQKLTGELPNYSNLLADDEVGHYLRGLALFIDGLCKSEHDVSGFIYPSHSGWLMSMTAAEQIAEYFTKKQDNASAAFFTDTAAFFGRINSAQFGIISGMMDIESWNEGMADGFYNIMTSANISEQSWMLGSLYKVIKDPVVKKLIFGRYLSVLKKTKAKYEAGEDKSAMEQVDILLEMVTGKSKGK